jgi:AraC family transcriptional activator of pobA
MTQKKRSIPVNTMAGEFVAGIAIGKASFKGPRTFEELEQSHRHDYHLFFLQEKGATSIEIDFKKYKIRPLSVIYIHPSQVHRMYGSAENVIVSGWSIDNENLQAEYLKLLEDIAPAKPLLLKKETFSIISEAVSLCIKLSERKHEKLYHSLLKTSCNTLVALVASQYLARSASTDKLTRSELITKSFKEILERNYITAKKPADYAQTLNMSTPYMNECVKNTTGHSVSYHIQQRIILEAKRLLYHTDKSVKEISNELGYEDYPYFSRLFTRITGMSALAFRNKNLG